MERVSWTNACNNMHMVGLFQKFRGREKLIGLSVSMKLVLRVFQMDFEMEVLQRHRELEAVEGCELETDDTISFGKFPHAYRQEKNSLSTLTEPSSKHPHTGANAHTPTDLH